MEADLDKNELLKPQHGELIGDRLLYTKYCGSMSAAHKQKRVCLIVVHSPSVN